MPKFNPLNGNIALFRQEWFDATRQAYQDCSQPTPDGHCRVALTDGTILAERTDASVVNAGGGVSAWLNNLDLSVHDTLNRTFPAAGLSSFSGGPDGSYALKVLRNSFGPWDGVEANGERWRLTEGDAHTIQMLGGKRAIWMIGVDDFCTPGLPIHLPTEHHYGLRAAWIPEYNRFIAVYQRASDGSLVCDNHIVAPPSDSYYYPDIEYRNNKVRITWSTSQADWDSPLIELTLAELETKPLSIGGNPIPNPTSDMIIKAFERKMWMAPFYSHSERYGDTPMPEHNGNAIICVENETDPNTLARELQKYSQLGAPLIVDGGKRSYPEYLDITIAYWAGNAASAQHALTLPEKPVIWYEDTNNALGWPAQKPSWANGNVWPAVQIYRGPGEALSSFRARAIELCNKIATYGQPFFMVPRFDDFNGSGSVAQTLEAMPIYIELINSFQIIGFLPFADRRGNGISKNPDLWQWARAFYYAMPARPNRFDYWQPSGMSMEEVLKNKFGQSTSLITMSKAEKDYVLNSFNDGPPDPEPPTTGEWPSEAIMLPILEQERAKFGVRVSAQDCVDIINRAAYRVKSSGLGLLKKGGGSHGEQAHTGIPCSTDWMIMTDGRGLDCIIDAGSSVDGSLGIGKVTWANTPNFGTPDPSVWVEPVKD